MRKCLRNLALAVGALALVVGVALPTASSQAAEKLKIYGNVGFEGNTWMDAAQNLMRAISKTKAYKDRVDFEIQSARGNAQTQIQQINAMVQAGADIIVAWPVSPTALNRAIRNACGKGVVFITFDSQVTVPCAYHVGINQDWAGAGPAEWLAEELGGKGNIVFMGGIPGNMVDTRRNVAAKAVFAEFEGIKIIADTPSMWNNATAKQKLTEILATHGWDKIDGLWTQTGCYVFTKMQVDAGRQDNLKPCAGNGTNGHRVAQLAPGTTEGAYGLRSASMGSPPWAAPLAFKLGVAIHDGADVAKNTEIRLPLSTPGDTVLCDKADLAELKAKNFACNAVPLDVAPSNYFIDVWDVLVPELDVYSALNGTVPAGQ
jgi:ribose transport system substrate-binding protein